MISFYEDFFKVFSRGYSRDIYKLLGHHRFQSKSVFRVWAPNAVGVSVVGDFCDWDQDRYNMFHIGHGIFEGVVPALPEMAPYKYCIKHSDGSVTLKSDPFGYYFEPAPNSASLIYDIEDFKWTDQFYISKKKGIFDAEYRPLNIYEVHLGSWKRAKDGSFLSYPEIARELAQYVKAMHYTHVELLPVMEHPFDGSWGYQITGYFAPTNRFGTPKEFMEFVDIMHRNGIGVILDWVPAHFPKDEVGLYRFDGTPCYEYGDSRIGEHKEWGTCVFDYGKPEVRSFLISNAYFWHEYYHIDGLRVDAVASMLYRDYNRRDGEWIPNIDGGNENYEVVEFFKTLNTMLTDDYPDTLLIAEESTAFKGVTAQAYEGGLGFSYKWNMGWMNDILKYMSLDPIYRKANHNLLTFSFDYAFSENFVLALSHDEVVHGKKSLINKMFGEYNEKFDALRLLLAFMMAHPGRKCTFMGTEFAQFNEWDYKSELDWCLLDFEKHRQFKYFVQVLNEYYCNNEVIHHYDCLSRGFQWISGDDCDQGVIIFRRKQWDEELVCVFNFLPVERKDYRFGVPYYAKYRLDFDSSWDIFGGPTPTVRDQIFGSRAKPMHSYTQSLCVDLPPLSAKFFYLTEKYIQIL